MVENKETKITDLLERDGVNTTVAAKEQGVIKKYKLRKLSVKDISPVVKILKKIDVTKLKDAVSNIDFGYLNNNVENENETEADNTGALTKLGGTLVLESIPIVLDALDNCLTDINRFFADLANVELEEIENLDLEVYFNLVYDFLNKEELTGFTKVVSKFLNTAK